jgi:DNA replication protein DnaC
MIPKRYEDVEFDKLPKVVQDKYPAIRKERRGLYIFGGVGTGKTYSAYGIYKQWQADMENETENIRTINNENKPDSGMRTDENGEKYYFEDKETQQRREALLAAAPKVRPAMRFENVPKMIYKCRRDYKDNTEYQDDLLTSGSVLILDDIGVEKVSEFVEEFMYLLINTQYEKVFPVIITSNLPLSQLAEKLGDRIVSRIKEMCDVIEIKGEDKRLGK